MSKKNDLELQKHKILQKDEEIVQLQKYKYHFDQMVENKFLNPDGSIPLKNPSPARNKAEKLDNNLDSSFSTMQIDKKKQSLILPVKSIFTADSDFFDIEKGILTTNIFRGEDEFLNATVHITLLAQK